MIDPRSISVVTFDCDGVMFDSSHANRAYYNQLLDHVGLPVMTPDQFEFAHMHTVDEAIEYLIPDIRLRQAARRYRRQMRYHDFIGYMVMESYLIPLLDQLRPAYKTAIATNRTDTMDLVLEQHGIEDRFDLVVTALDVRQPKPHPEQLHMVLNRFSLSPDQMLYIGDSQLDQAAASAAGVPFVAFDNSELVADVHVNSLRQVADLLGLA